MITGKYTATDLAQFFIDKGNELKKPISNLQLQKILFFSWRDYYTLKKEYLFSDHIEAWQYGHVVPIVYYKYSRYSAMKLIFRYESEINECDFDCDFLTKVLERYVDKPISALVNESHQKGRSWHKIYPTHGETVIPFKTIIKLDCG